MPPFKDRWPLFAAEVQRDLAVYLAMLIALSGARLAFLFRFRDRLAPETVTGDLLAALATGVRFDAKAAAAIALVALTTCTLRAVWSGEPGQRLRSAWAALCTAVIVFLALLRIEYFVEFNDLYNEILFIAPGDDFTSIVKTAAAANGMVGKLLFITAVGVAVHALLRRMLPRIPFAAPRRWRSPAVRTAAIVVVAAFFVVSFRGRLWGAIFRPIDAAVTADAFLNKAVLDDFSSLRAAYQQRRKLTMDSAESSPETVRAAARRLFGTPPKADFEALALRHARGARIEKPRHIFVIVGESFAAWPLLDNYAPLHMADELKALMAEPEAATVRPFLPASSSTMTSITALVTGLFDVDLETNYRSQSKRPYATSIAPLFESLGYRTRFYYGGFPSWQRLADFAREQGFDDVYAAGNSRAKLGTWGVDDFGFFTGVLRDFSDEAPTFNVVLTTSNHSPFEADLGALGIREADFASHDGGDTARRRAHFAYADKAIVSFVRALRARYPDSLFVITGDHAQRLLPEAAPGLFVERAVPFVIWGKGVSANLFPADAAGGHLSIAPTLVELIAPAGFAYHAWVGDLLTPGGVGFQRYVWVSSQGIGRIDGRRVEPLPWAAGGVASKPEGVAENYLAYRSLSAWRILRGAQWVDSPPPGPSAATRSD